MIKSFALVIGSGPLAGCGSAPKAAPVRRGPRAAPQRVATRSAGVAETMPVISKLA